MTIVVLTLLAILVALAAGFRLGLHAAMLGVETGARRRLTAEERQVFDALVDKALGGATSNPHEVRR